MTSFTRRELLRNTLALATLTVSQGFFSTFAVAAQSDDSRAIQEFFELTDGRSIGAISVRHKAEIAAIYKHRNYQPLWSKQGSPTYTSKAILGKLSDSHTVGLYPSKYYSRLLHQIINSTTTDHLLQYDIIMTDALYTYFDDIAHGYSRQRSGGSDWNLKKSNINVTAIAGEFFTGNYSFRQTLQELEPGHSRYHGLIGSLTDHLNMSARGNWTKIPSGRILQPGDSERRVSLLKQRLFESGDLAAEKYSETSGFDAAVTEALMIFQQRHGLDPDGVLGPMTIAELNVSLSDRIAQLEMNIDRWRWLTRSSNNSNIIVNVPGYDMDLNIDGTLAMTMKVIVGKTKNRTPLFSDEMEHLVVNPSWYVPSSIAREILPKELARPGYLKQRNFEVLSRSSNRPVPLNTLSPMDKQPENFLPRFRLRQKPGKVNALGDVKFMFPNRHNVYLHDTTAKRLFSKNHRAFSHGCVRLEKPFDLAKTLLQADGRSTSEIDAILSHRSTKKVHLRSRLPVHLTYQTAWLDESGRTHFRADIYGHDKSALRNLDRSKSVYANSEADALDKYSIKLVSNSY